ncbi:MAG: hypothetical protein PHP46_02105 [Candidatus Omnitrophica bacterium]|nr:hypothetical protein [Candidatus Omnitrophota bacterium]
MKILKGLMILFMGLVFSLNAQTCLFAQDTGSAYLPKEEGEERIEAQKPETEKQLEKESHVPEKKRSDRMTPDPVGERVFEGQED